MLEGRNVVLRAIERDDVRRLAELFEDLELSTRASSCPPKPWPLSRYESRYEHTSTQDDQVDFAIVVADEVIGECNLHGLDHYHGVAEIGLSLGRDYWGQGFGQDALRTLAGYAFRHLNLQRLWLEVLAEDGRAVGAYKAAGFVEEGRLRRHAWFDGAYRDVLVMSLLRDEWIPDS